MCDDRPGSLLLVILIPVSLTFIGIMLGQWLMGAPFTATALIGFIPLSGIIIVCNSILLVDFIRRRCDEEAFLRQALLEAAQSASSQFC